jgi:hypothetical protein
MIFKVQVRTASTPIATTMALAVVVAGLTATVPARAQSRGNAQAEQSQTLRNQDRSDSLPVAGRYVSDSGEAFVLGGSGRQALLRFERRDETWVLRPTPAPRGDIIYRNDAGEQVLRVTPDGGMTIFTPVARGGSPVSFAGPGPTLTPPSLGPAQLFTLMARRSGMITQALGRLVEINLDTGNESESLAVDALIISTDAVMRIARSPSARSSLNRLQRITIIEGDRAAVTYTGDELRIVVAPNQGLAGRPSSARVIRAFLPQD